MKSTVPVVHAPKSHKGLAVVAFIDLLGFSNNINQHWHDTENNPLDVIQKLKRTIRSEKATPVSSIVFEGAVEYTAPRVTTVSDSIVIVQCLEVDSLVDFLAAFNIVAAAAAKAQNLAASAGYATRGAIELGHVFWDEDEIIGPCFNSVYHLESKVARTSRILVGPNALEVFKRNWKVNNTNKFMGNSFYASNDGLIAMRPDARAEADYRLLREKRPEFTEKYNEFIHHCRYNLYYSVRYKDMVSGLEKLLAKGLCVDPHTVAPSIA